MVKVATNQEYLNAYNEYLQSHNQVEAVTNGYIMTGQQVVPINFDMFFGFIIDKIVLSVMNKHSFMDKLADLYNGNLDVGATIEEKMTVLKTRNYQYDTHDFEADVENPYKKHKKGLVVCFHTITDYKKITVTVSYQQLKTACLTEGGVDDLVNSMINDVQVEYSAWAYQQKKKALTQMGYVQTIYFKDYADFNLKLKGVKIDVTNYDDSWKHNACLELTPTTENNLVIVMSERFKNKVDIEVFTGLFNVSYAELKDRIIYIDQFEDPEVVCGIYDKRGFYFKRVLDTSRELENGADLSRNRWLHFWRMHSVSPFHTAVVFKEKKDGSYDDVVTMLKGYDEDTKQFLYVDGQDENFYTVPMEDRPLGETGSFRVGNSALYPATNSVEITNPKSLYPVVVKYYSDSEGKNLAYVQRVRFEYPSEIDATLGHERVK